MKKVYFAISIVIVILFEIAFAAFTSRDYRLVSTIHLDENTDYEYPAQVVAHGNGFAVAGKKELQVFDRNGVLRWSKKLYSFGALCASSGDTLAVCEKNVGEFYILSDAGEILYISDKLGRVLDFKAFDDRSYGVLTEHGVYIYSGAYEKTYYIDLQAGDIIDFGYSDKHKKVAIVTLDSDVNCYLNLLTITGEITAGQIVQEGLVFNVYLGEDKITVLRDDGIFEYDYFLESAADGSKWNASRESTAQDALWKTGDMYSYNYADDLLCAAAGEGCALWRAGERLITLSQPSKKCYSLGELYLLKGSELALYDDKGEEKRVLANADEVLDIIKLDNSTFAVVYSNKVEIYGR